MELDSRKKSRRNRMMRLFQNRFFQFSGPPGLRLAFLAAKKNKNLAAFSAREVIREQQQRKEKERSIPL